MSNNAWPYEKELHKEIEQLRTENAQLKEKLAKIQNKVNEQADDKGLWFIANKATEDYLQRGLRDLHRVIEQEEKLK